MMKNLSINKQIRSEFLKIRMSIAIVDINTTTLWQFVNKLNDAEWEEFNHYPLLWRMRLAFWDMAILELYKLYKEDEGHSLIAFVNSLINSYKRINWINNIKLSELTNHRKSLEILGDTISKLMVYRNEVVAHSGTSKPDSPLYLEDLFLLLDNAKTIYNSINHALNDEMTIWQEQENEYDLALIRNAYKYNQLRNELFKADIQKKPTIDTKSLMSVIA